MRAIPTVMNPVTMKAVAPISALTLVLSTLLTMTRTITPTTSAIPAETIDAMPNNTLFFFKKITFSKKKVLEPAPLGGNGVRALIAGNIGRVLLFSD